MEPRVRAAAQARLRSSSAAALCAGMLLPPAAFLLNLQLNYTLVALACDRVATLLYLIAGFTLGMALTGGWLAWLEWRRRGAQEPDEQYGALPRRRFLATLGLLSSGLFVLLILAGVMTLLLQRPCSHL